MSKLARECRLPLVLALAVLASLACTGDGGGEEAAQTETGDGDPTTGDGDGDPGDGDPTTGDGDGDPTTGDGDGDPTPTLPEDFPDVLTDVDGCGDVNINATNADGTVAIFFSGAPLAATAHEMGMPLQRVSVLPSADVDLRIAIGTDLGETCTDTGDGPQIAHAWTAVSGTVTLSVTPTGMPQPWETPADATLELTDVTFEGEGRDSVVIDSLVFPDVYVGWLPG